MPTCSAYGCTNRCSKKIPGITFHKFPYDAARKEIWVQALQRKNWYPTNHSCVCSVHFKESDLDRTSLCRVRIREEAVPSIFPAFPSYLHKVKRKLNRRRRNDDSNVEAFQEQLKIMKMGEEVEEPVIEKRRECNDDSKAEAFQKQLKIMKMGEEIEEPAIEIKEELFEEAGIAACDIETLTLAKLCDETFSTFITLPSTLWGMHVEHGATFVAFTHLSESTSNIFVMTDKALLLEADLVPKVFVRGLKATGLPLPFLDMPLQSFTELNAFLQEIEALSICSGTGVGVRASFGDKCTLYLPQKQRVTRCGSCADRRTRLKRTEAQRLRRAGARAEKKKEHDEDDLTLRVVGEQDELEESAEDSEGIVYNES